MWLGQPCISLVFTHRIRLGKICRTAIPCRRRPIIPVAGFIEPLNRSGRCFHLLLTDVPESVSRAAALQQFRRFAQSSGIAPGRPRPSVPGCAPRLAPRPAPGDLRPAWPLLRHPGERAGAGPGQECTTQRDAFRNLAGSLCITECERATSACIGGPVNQDRLPRS